jgi:uncharacterized circularly permuted ATP-grasp superfamily protein/uncharacterized alpha-E superfamily protein
MPARLLKDYAPALGRYDEMFAASASTPDELPNQVRDHWRGVLEYLAKESSASMQHRVEAVRRKVLENGVTYNVYADPKGIDRPWELDVVPLMLSAQEWAQIEAGVAQRATLLNHILLDIYGPQNLMADGRLPSSLIEGHAGFLRPCHGIQNHNGTALHFYAVDLARSPDGHWWAVADRTQAPSGAGYALENRMVISRNFPELFRDLNVQRLAGFFSTMRDSLAHFGRQCVAYQGQDLAAHQRALTVLLTPGPYNETYYEQSYLARYLGFPLVQGSDLTVRDGFVWLKTLAGLQRVHVILRRVDDDYCDPLELRPESALGVAGLTEAARRGTVVIANSLGSNLLESGALLGYLPSLSKSILGEQLKMPSVATWWCGEPAAMSDAISRIDQLVFKPAFPQIRTAPVFGEDLDSAQRADFIAKLTANPQNYVAQELVRISQAPVWTEQRVDQSTGSVTQGLKTSAVGLRVFACATSNGYVVMPGGLTRVATGPDARVISMQRGGSSKDTWVIAKGAVNNMTLLAQPTQNTDLVRGETQLASRTVENLFWYGRYSERCDNTARLMRRSFDGLVGLTPDKRSAEWPTLVALCQFNEILSEKVKPADDNIEALLLKAMHSLTVQGLAYQVDLLFRVAFNLRERLSADNWRSLNGMLQKIGKPDPKLNISDALALLDQAAESLMTITGFAIDGMTRDIGWRFLSIGRRIERLQFMGSVIQHSLTMPAKTNPEWLLELGDSVITYRSRYMAQPEWLPTLDLLLLDESNPRGVLFQLTGLLGYLNRISQFHGPCGQHLIEPLIAQLRALDPANDLRPGSEKLLALMRQIYSSSYQLSEQLAARFFSYAGVVEPNMFRGSHG